LNLLAIAVLVDYYQCMLLFFQTDCGLLSHPANGQVMLLNGTTLGSVANYSCNPGYTLSGPMSRACVEISVWSGFNPGCINSEY